jgi:hypothetical protein
MRLSLVLTLSAALAFIVPAAHAAPSGSSTTLVAAKKKHTHRHRPARRSGQIACTAAGCQRIPPHCHPETEYDWNGIPTGFDTIVCR